MAAKKFWVSNYRYEVQAGRPILSRVLTDDFEVTDDTETTTEQFQEQYANLYAMGFRLVIE